MDEPLCCLGCGKPRPSQVPLVCTGPTHEQCLALWFAKLPSVFDAGKRRVRAILDEIEGKPPRS